MTTEEYLGNPVELTNNEREGYAAFGAIMATVGKAAMEPATAIAYRVRFKGMTLAEGVATGATYAEAVRNVWIAASAHGELGHHTTDKKGRMTIQVSR